MARKPAFTLIEILIVVIILAILAAIVMPALTGEHGPHSTKTPSTIPSDAGGGELGPAGTQESR